MSRDDKKHSSRIDDIEILRAIAILITLLDHLRFMFRWENTTLLKLETFATFWTGVDLFFAISGFVIARDLLNRYDRATTTEQVWRETFAFWIRRVYRIWPTSWFWAALIVVFSIALRPSDFWPQPRPALADLAAVIMHVVNIHQWACVHSLTAASCGLTTVWWSLSLEEQFYLVLPLLLLATPRRYLPWALTAIIGVQFFQQRGIWSLGWVLRTDALAMGVLLALFERTSIYRVLTPKFMDNRAAAFAVMVTLIFLLVELPSNYVGKIEIVPFSTGLVAVVAAFTVFLASYDRNVMARNRLVKSVLLWIGSRSYAIYLIHSFCLALTPQIWKWMSPAGTAFGPNWTIRFLLMFFGLTFILAELNYRLIETPIRNKGREVAQRIAGSSGSADSTRAHLAHSRSGAGSEVGRT